MANTDLRTRRRRIVEGVVILTIACIFGITWATFFVLALINELAKWSSNSVAQCVGVALISIIVCATLYVWLALLARAVQKVRDGS